MRINDLVQFRITRSHAVAYGVLVHVNLLLGTCVVARDGKRYDRELKRVKPSPPKRR